jgi:hypothetical protein
MRIQLHRALQQLTAARPSAAVGNRLTDVRHRAGIHGVQGDRALGGVATRIEFFPVAECPG